MNDTTTSGDIAQASDIPRVPLNGKRTIEDGGFHNATIDPERIAEWSAFHIGCNWGTPTGHHRDAVTGESNRFAFDVLDLDDAEGLAFLAGYEANHGPLPLTPRQRTGSGGLHILFAHAEGIRNSAGKIAPGVDIRGDGGYIAFAGSIHPRTGKPYKWEPGLGLYEIPLAPWPDDLLEIIRAASKRAKVEPGARITKGIQESTLTRIAGAMRRQGSTDTEILAALRVASKERCDPPVAEPDLERMAKSVGRYPPLEPLLPMALSDVGNAERFEYINADRAMCCASLNKWYCLGETHWAPDDAHTIDEWAAETIRLMGQEAWALPTDDTRKAALTTWAIKSESDRRLTDMVKRARGKLAVRAKDLDADPWLLNVENGVLDLRTGQLRPHDPADRMTKLAPVTYDADATLPEWDAFLADTTAGKEGLADFLQLAMGYSLTGLTSEEKLFLVHGPAGSGKSTLVEAIKATLGDYAATADFEAFIKHQSSGGPRNDIARLTGARYVSSIEVEQGKQLAEALVKAITGGDTVAARFLYAESVEYKPSLKLWLVANDAPTFNADDTGMHRRLLRLPLDNVVPDHRRDPRIKALLIDPKQAGPAILAWAVKGCLKWQELGRLPVPEVVKVDTAKYLAEQDGLCRGLQHSHWLSGQTVRGSKASG